MSVLDRWTPLFFFNDTATTEIYTLSLHDALPIFIRLAKCCVSTGRISNQIKSDQTRQIQSKLIAICKSNRMEAITFIDRKSIRLNSSHSQISYAVFCLKKKKKISDSYLLSCYRVV